MKDAYYFPHDCNAIDDPKIMVMISDMGLEAYAIYWILIEHLRQQPNFISHVKILKPLSRRHDSTEAKFQAVVLDYGLFLINEREFFFSKSLVERMQPYLEKSERARSAALKRWNNANADANALQMQSGRNASKVKESKVKKTNIPAFEEFKEYALTKEPRIDTSALRYKYESWIENDWHNGNGKKIQNWKTSLLNTIPHMTKVNNTRTY